MYNLFVKINNKMIGVISIMKISDKRLQELYSESVISRHRYENAEKKFKSFFGYSDYEFFSAPGRTEIIGNHTDHNGGKVIASSISLDTIAVATPNYSDEICIISEGYDEQIVVSVNKDYKDIDKSGTFALIAGMVDAIKEFGYNVSGFSAYVTSDVIAAAGVSSSASFEMLICSIVNTFFNDGKISYIDYAKIGQRAENKYWNKASGLMDQLACAIGGMIEFDFEREVKYESIPFSFQDFGFSMVVINSESNHAMMSDEYSLIPFEMYSIARKMGVEKLAELPEKKFWNGINLCTTDEAISDRAILRAIHFYNENKRVSEMSQAMKVRDLEKILNLLKESGDSSWKYLQNCYEPGNAVNQNVALNLAVTEHVNRELKGACRVHGGGFSGVILEILPTSRLEDYVSYMGNIVGQENIYILSIRKVGAIHV
jgi:galactokinase